jgi:hypothetical protein
MHNKTNNQSGFLDFFQGRFFITLVFVAALTALMYYGTAYGREYYKIKMSETCSERMWIIENAKAKYISKHGAAAIGHYSDLLPYLPFGGFPMCPWGGTYENMISTTEQVTCTKNGDPDCEPNTPGENPLANGYQDLAKPQQAMGLYEFFNRKRADGATTDSTPAPPKKSKMFGD